MYFGAYDIRYAARKALKAQALADFIAKLTLIVPTKIKRKEEWKVWINGAFGSIGFGIGILLKGLHQTKLWYTIKLNFSATNTMAKYETLLIGLRILKEVRATKAKILIILN